MAGFIKRRGNVFFQSQNLAAVYSKFQRNNCTVVEGVMEKCSSTFPVMKEDINSVDTSKWKKVRASDAGIRNSMVPEYSLNVLRVLKRQGFDAYLVGGCVRDLILHRVPKDYDVITTANLKQIRKLFHRAQVIGKRFPICHVWMGGSIIEVSSFDTVAQSDSDKNNLGKSKEKSGSPQKTEAKKNSSLFKMYSGWDVKDCNRWKNSLQRDFTINSLFFDPLDFKVYDYANGMEDLKDLKLRTLIPARVSFKQDCARILRGLRIAARLGLSLSKDIETAIPEFVSSVTNLDQFRLIMEMNYMLAYGAAAPSILLLMKFKLLHHLLPFQAAYLDQASKTSQSSSFMLVRLLSNMDKLVSCDQPADSRLWIAVLAFHIALVRNPQEITVVRAFASLLYHGNWNKAVQFAREQENSVTGFAPEVSKSSRKRSDEDLAVAVSEFTHLLDDALYVLTQMESLREALYLYPDFKCSGLVFVPKKKGREVGEVFGRLSDVESYESKKPGFSIDYSALGKGNPFEISFVLGKIILDTIAEGVVIERLNSIKKKQSSKPSKKHNNDHAPNHDSEASSVSKAQPKILKKAREENEHMNDKETESTLTAPEKNQDQSVVQKKKKRRSKDATPVSEVSKPKTSKRSRSDEPGTVPPVSEPPNKRSSKKGTRKVKRNEIQEAAEDNLASEKSMKDILKVLEKSPKSTLTAPEKNQDQSLVQKQKKRRSKDAPVSEVSKPKTSKRSRPDEQETVPPVSEPPKQRTSKNETRKAKSNIVVKEAEDNLASDKSSQQQEPSSKEESDSLSSETTKRPRRLSSLFTTNTKT